MQLNSLDDLLLHELQDLYSAEDQISQALPKMVEKATDPDLKEAFKMHYEQTKGQLDRLIEIGQILDIKVDGKHCKGMEGLLKEGEELLQQDPSEFLDQALIAAAQRVEHYEIAGYGCAVTFAKLLEHDEVEELLKETLDEEEETDEKLTEIAEKEQDELE